MISSADPLFIEAARVLDGDGDGDLEGLEARVSALSAAGLRVHALEIESLRSAWRGRPDRRGPGFQSGCAPILALARAREVLTEGAADAVVIRGDEPLRTGYDRPERRRLMQVYGDTSIPEVYTRLAHLQRERLGLEVLAYQRLAEALFANYARTAGRRGLATTSAHGQEAATSLFRLADCANPNLDFRGAVLLGGPRAAQVLHRPVEGLTRLLGVAVELVADGPEHLGAIVDYAHLARAYRSACDQAGLDFAARFHAGEALLEAYTCFPPPVIGLLLATRIAPDPASLEPVLARREVTVTGGMNLAGAPWNNPALHALIVLLERLDAQAPRTARAGIGLVHGNGGVGGYQGVAIVGACPGAA
jgi:hypothetical protein